MFRGESAQWPLRLKPVRHDPSIQRFVSSPPPLKCAHESVKTYFTPRQGCLRSRMLRRPSRPRFCHRQSDSTDGDYGARLAWVRESRFRLSTIGSVEGPSHCDSIAFTENVFNRCANVRQGGTPRPSSALPPNHAEAGWHACVHETQNSEKMPRPRCLDCLF
jgi:hypothetical protein